MAIYAFPDFESGKVKRIYASARYPSKQSGNVFFDSDLKIRIYDDVPKETKGFFACLAFKASHVFAARDVLGGKPLYYRNLCFSSFKSYVGDAIEVLPGEVLKFDYEGNLIERKKFEFEDVFKVENIQFDDALEKIERSLLKIKIRSSCIAFSGGLDSSLLAALYDLPLIAVTAKKDDEEKIKEAARMLGKDLEIWRVSKDDVFWATEKALRVVEMSDFLQISIAVPVFLTMYKAKLLGYSSILFGSGADELFGGYKKYESLKDDELEKALINDVKRIGEKNLVRDSKISYENEIKLITPYLDWDVIEVAVNMPANVKVRKVDGKVVRKFALRKLAENYLPKELVWREKKAIQYSTGIAKLVRECFSQIGKVAGF